jgi:putative cell wall-binding protein
MEVVPMDRVRITVLIALFMLVGSGLAVAQAGSKVILVSDNEADSAVAATVESVKGIKVVVTPWGKFNQSVVDQIRELGPEEVLIIGGPAAVPSAYETALLEFTNTVRVAGKDRYATAARVLDLFRDDFKGKGAIAAYGYDKKGIEKALKKAKAQGMVVVFVDLGRVPWEVQKALENAGISHLEVEESPNMNTTEIKDDVEDDVGEVRFTGVDRALRASEQIQEAKKEISEAEEKIAELNVTATAPLELLNNAKEHLKRAEEAFNESKYGEAFGLAVAAEHLADNAEDIAEEVAEYWEESREELKELQEKVSEKIEDLREDIIELEEKVLKAEEKGVNTSDIKGYLEQAKLKLGEAESALGQGNTSTAVAELREAKNLLALADVSLERKEEALEKGEERELEIEVEIKGGIAKVEVEINEDETKFVLNTVDRAEIIAEIASRTGLTTAEIESVIEFEVEEEEIEIEVEIEKGMAKVKIKIGETEEKFTLNTTNEEEIISEIMERTDLTREQIEKNIEFEGDHAELGGQEIEREEEEEEGKSSGIGEAEEARERHEGRS